METRRVQEGWGQKRTKQGLLAGDRVWGWVGRMFLINRRKLGWGRNQGESGHV